MNSLRRESQSSAGLDLEDLTESWRLLDLEERLEAFLDLPRAQAEDFFLELSARDVYELIMALPADQRRSWMRLLPPDDAADVVQEADEDERDGLMALLDEQTRQEVRALLAYAEDDAGGLMNPRFARVRPDVSVDEAIRYLRRQASTALESLYYIYAVDADQKLAGVVSFRDLFSAAPGKTIRDIMVTDVVSSQEDTDQEELGRLFAQYDLQAIPVVDAEGRM